MASQLVIGIVLIIIGIIIWAVSRYFPPGLSTAAYYGGIILAVVGVILLVLAIVGIGVMLGLPFMALLFP